MFQQKDVEKIRKVLNNDSENFCDWFADNKLSVFLASQRKINFIKKSYVKYNKGIEIKQVFKSNFCRLRYGLNYIWRAYGFESYKK